MNYKWSNSKLPDEKITSELSSSLGIDSSLTKLLVQRGITNFEEAKEFFRPNLKALHDPYLMKDMDKAVERIEIALKQNQKILVYGDYDVDGTTAVSLLSSFLRKKHSLIDTYIPDRYKEGYGVSKAGIDYAHDQNIPLIIALDCGIKALDKVDYANSLGIDFIICDHHRPGKDLPNAVAILDPKQTDCLYPYDELSGCGVGFKLVQALCKKWNLDDSNFLDLLDLLAVSIGSDIVPINGENRILTYWGLKKINENPRSGFKLLIKLAGKENKALSIMDVVFLIGPRINAAGRISHGQLAVNLLTSDSVEKLEESAAAINVQNDERKVLDKKITEQALEAILKDQEENTFSTVVYNPEWHKGVIGIVASRLIENYYRPTIVFTESNNVLAGSARSVKGFDVYNALDECRDLLEQFGGHKYAAGMTLAKENFEAFKTKFEQVVQTTILPEQRRPEISIDHVLTFSEITDKFFKILNQFAPFGPMNMAPVFVSHNISDTGLSKIVGADKKHLRLVVKDPKDSKEMIGIAFNMADKLSIIQSGKPFSLAYHIDTNEFRGNVSLQLRVMDIKYSSEISSLDEISD